MYKSIEARLSMSRSILNEISHISNRNRVKCKIFQEVSLQHKCPKYILRTSQRCLNISETSSGYILNVYAVWVFSF